MIEVEIGSGLRNLAAPIENEFAFGADLVSVLLQDTWKAKALEVHAYRTGAYYGNIHQGNAAAFGDTRIRDVIGDIGYDDIIERGRTDTPNYPGRFPADKAVDAAASGIESILSDAAGRVVDRIENG